MSARCGDSSILSVPFLVFALLSMAACGVAQVDVEPTVTAPTSAPTSAPTQTAPLEPATSTSPPATDTPSPTSTPAPEEAVLQVVGQIGGQSLAVAVQGSIAYLGVGPRVVTLDVSVPRTPQPLGQSDVLPGVVRDIAVVQGLAYVAAGDAGLRVLDVADPATPREMGSAPASAAAQVVAVQDRMAYVGESTCNGGDCTGSLRAIDVSAPGDPQAIGFLEVPDAVNDVVLVAEYAYVAHRQGLTVVDISDPVQPLEVGSLPLQGSAEDIAIAGGQAYVVSGPYLLVLDTSSPAAPRQVGSSSIIFYPNAVATAGDHALVSDGFCEFGQCGGHLRVLGLSDLAEPRETGALGFDDLVVDVVVADGLAYVVTWESGLTVVDLADPASPQPLGTFDTSGSIENVALSGEYAYATAGGENGLLVLDVMDPTAPRSVGALPMLFAGAVALADGYAYVPVWVEGLRVVDVRDPANPVEVAALESTVLQGTADRVAVDENHLYLTVQEGGLMTLDVGDPTDPRPVGAYSPPAGAIRGVALAHGYAYATGSTTEGGQGKGVMYVIDLADPARPSLVASVELPDHTSSDVALAGDYAYVTLADCYYFTCSGSLQVVDVSDPTQPRLASSLDVPGGAFALTVADDAEGGGGYGYLAAGDEGVWIVDLSEPAQPHLGGRADTPGRARDVAVVGDLVYAGDGRGGFLVLRVVSATSAPTQITVPEAATSTSPLATDTPSPTLTAAPEEAALQVVGQIGGQSMAVVVQGSIAYLGVGPRLVTLDVSAPGTPQLLGQSDVLPGVVRDIAVVEGVAYVAAGDAGLRVLDVSDPANPREIGSASVRGGARAVAVQDRIACVVWSRCAWTNCIGGLSIMDISAPRHPRPIGGLGAQPDRPFGGVAVAGNYAYLSRGPDLTVVDISDPAQPIETGAFGLAGGCAPRIAIAGVHAYLVSGTDLLVLDISSPAAPRKVSSFRVAFSWTVMAAMGDHVLVSDGSHLRALDVSDPAEPREIGALGLEGGVDVAVADGLAYVVTLGGGLSIVDLTDPVNPRLLGTFSTSSGSIYNVALSGEYAFTTAGDETGLLVLDVTDPTAPRSAGALPRLFGGPVALADGYAYVPVWAEGLRVVDVSDPANPVEVAALENSVLQGTAERVVLGDAPPGRSGQAYAYLTVREGGLRTLDITDPVHPHPVGAYTPPAGAIRGVAVARRYAYAWGTTEGRQGKEVMYVIDLADPTRPDLVASVELPDQTSSDVPLEAWSSDVALAGDYAYVTMAISDFGYRRSSGSLHVIDVSDPTQPWLVSSLDVPDEVFAMVVSDGAAGGGRYGYLAAKNEGLWVVDVSDPIQPQLVGLADTPDCARDITVVDDLVYVADGDGGLLILRAMEDS